MQRYKIYWYKDTQGHRNKVAKIQKWEIHRYKDITMQTHRDTKIWWYKDAMMQRYKDKRIQEKKDARMQSAHIGKLLILLHVNFLLTEQKLIWSSSLQQNNPGKLSILHSVLQSSPNSKIYPKNPSFSPISSFQVKSCHHSSHMSLASLDCPAG